MSDGLDLETMPTGDSDVHATSSQRPALMVLQRSATPPQKESVPTLMLHVPLTDFVPHYNDHETTLAKDTLKATLKNGWWVLDNNRPYVPSSCAWELVQRCHESTHFGKKEFGCPHTEKCVCRTSKSCPMGMSRVQTTSK